MEIGEKYLPIGTVVKLEGGIKKIMITGFCCGEENNATDLWDYCGCLYPEGIMIANQTICFNHSQIEKIYYKGLENEEEQQFKKELKEINNNNGLEK